MGLSDFALQPALKTNIAAINASNKLFCVVDGPSDNRGVFRANSSVPIPDGFATKR